MEPFYKKCSQPFRAYIEKNLTKLSADRSKITKNGFRESKHEGVLLLYCALKRRKEGREEGRKKGRKAGKEGRKEERKDEREEGKERGT